jgi:hypothetical protein
MFGQERLVTVMRSVRSTPAARRTVTTPNHGHIPAGSVYDLIAKIWAETDPVYDLPAIDTTLIKSNTVPWSSNSKQLTANNLHRKSLENP